MLRKAISISNVIHMPTIGVAKRKIADKVWRSARMRLGSDVKAGGVDEMTR
jgi:hypothetical protein